MTLGCVHALRRLLLALAVADVLALRAALPAARMIGARIAPRIAPHASGAAGGTDETATASWYEEGAAASSPTTSMPMELSSADTAPAEEEVETTSMLTEDDLLNTRWKVLVTPREGSWMLGGEQLHEFTLLADGSVVWGERAGGFGTGGRWTLSGETIEVIRSTPLGIATGRDYYMSSARAEVSKQLQFAVRGVIRSYNAVYPVAVVADFVAVRMPGRFVRD
eukprot:CAMPEP_0119379856 /NCGR_PEP_ID=MMETSP1334-20130426/54352_1 /TAXON_ID=127549 /ORGANISM="Calcidiscus leptoporus, Strain RCC1130" /LENGTH=222 /DNA_ID=CAMNT_0007399483 /DNA_START=9 /DNA_END=677 /DNA_ORIENTATION=-